MVKIERGGIPIRENTDLVKIPDRTIRILAQYFLEQHAGQLDLEYEPHEFVLPNPDGHDRRTKPDLRVIPHKITRGSFYIEATLAYREEIKESRGAQMEIGADFKARQKEIMDQEDDDYFVYYREELERIQRHFPKYDFFNIPMFKSHLNGQYSPKT